MTDDVPVMQVDREAAAQWRRDATDADMTVGDYGALVQAFARHRLAALSSADAEVERLRKALRDLVSWFDGGPIAAGEYGADAALAQARAALTNQEPRA